MPLNRNNTDETLRQNQSSSTVRQLSSENPPNAVVNIPLIAAKDTEDFTLVMNSGATTANGQRNTGLQNP